MAPSTYDLCCLHPTIPVVLLTFDCMEGDAGMIRVTPYCFPSPSLAVKLNSNRQVTGVLLGFDAFMNLVLDKSIDDKLRQDLGIVVGVFLHRWTLGGHLTVETAGRCL